MLNRNVKIAVKSMIINLPDAEATQALGRKLGESLPPGSVILLEGDLGAGKTTLVQGIGTGLGIKDSIDSPTFTLINEYHDGRLPLYHLDLYRLENEEIFSLYLDLYWEQKEFIPGITAIEWAEKLLNKTQNYIQIRLTYTETESRQARIQLIGESDWDLFSLKLM